VEGGGREGEGLRVRGREIKGVDGGGEEIGGGMCES